MTTEFIEDRIWPRLTAAARGGKGLALIAVAYLSEGASRRLPLRRGSVVVVNASVDNVKKGSTCPADLLRLQKKGVRVFNVTNLHAKVYVFGRQAFIGSANASETSANRRKEAMVRTTERGVVADARAFVRGLCQEELGPETLASLQKLYRRPKFPGGTRRSRSKATGRVRAEYSPIRLAQLTRGDGYPEGSETAYQAGLRAAKSRRKHRKTHFLDEFRWNNDTIRRGDLVVQVVDEGDGPRLVTPPGSVLNTKRWSNGRSGCTFVYLEVPNLKRVRVNKLAKRLGRGAGKKLRRSGRVGGDLATKLREAWRR
jgi:hypothetical protein